MPKQ
jgi:hypothetical protein